MNQTTTLTKQEQDQLWQRILSFPFDAPDARLPFSRRLARENKWDYDFGLKAIEEYRRFIFLCCISPQGASPSKVIDEVWHLHLIYTQNYWEEFCGKTLKLNVHHHPSGGGPQEKHKHENWQTDTLELYRNTFHTAPPPEYWDDKHIPTGFFRRFLKRILLLPLLLPLFLLTACNDIPVFAPVFIGFMIVIGAVIGGAQVNSAERKKKNESDGSGCGGSGGSSCGSSCSSGCGGGCGGCGGGGGD